MLFQGTAFLALLRHPDQAYFFLIGRGIYSNSTHHGPPSRPLLPLLQDQGASLYIGLGRANTINRLLITE